MTVRHRHSFGTGLIQLIVVDADPDGSDRAPQGSKAFHADGREWKNTDGATTWSQTDKPARGLYGDGSDGDVTLTGDIVLARDMFYQNLDLASYNVDTNCFKLYCSKVLTIPSSSRIHCDGASGDGGDAGGGGGAAGVTGTLDCGVAGGNNAVNGSNVITSEGGDGGNGGDGITSAGAGGTATQPTATDGGFHHRNAAQFGGAISASTPGWTFVKGGAGGGGGGNDGGSDGGGGGAGGGYCFIAAETVDLQSGGFITANGGDGGDGASGSNAGGGGGGGGGITMVMANQFSNDGTFNAIGGTGGSGIGTGLDGSDGSSGLVMEFV